MNYKNFLILFADKLDREEKFELADDIDENFEEFLKMLENGELIFDESFTGTRDPYGPYSNRGSGLSLSGIPGPQ